jgi:Glycosyl transferase family 2
VATDHKIDYLGKAKIDIRPGCQVALAVVRNEAIRLPFLLNYYRGIGVDRFIFIDNDSTDGSREMLLAQSDSFVFLTENSFAEANCGYRWVNGMLDRFCDGCWTAVIDADECLLWPDCEGKSIKILTERFDKLGAEALFTIVLDMYSNKPFGKIGYVPGESFVKYSGFLDRGPYSMIEAKLFPFQQIYGGVRARLFQQAGAAIHPPTMSTVPLIRWRKGRQFLIGRHGLNAGVWLAPMRGALLHFKMFDDLQEKCRIEVARGEHFDGAREYKVLLSAIEAAKGHSFYDPTVSIPFTDTQSLIALGLMSDQLPFGRI